jgi:glycosyltransferase A (GT-A) superfamily protein (DUF2064 family)
VIAATLLVVAKAPVAGFAKTRLTPALTPAEAADVAAAALLDTLDAVCATEVAHRVVALIGDLDAAERGGEIARALADFEVVPQRGAGFGERLANAHADAARRGLPVLQLGMDTPQVRPAVLSAAATDLAGRAGHALLGPATDGGWWALGLPSPQPARLLVDVPMSTSRTAACTRDMLFRCGYRVRDLEPMTDADTFGDAVGIASATEGRFARLVRALHQRGTPVPG